MSQSASRRARRRRVQAQARQLTKSGADLDRLIPQPPEPAWAHWWDGKRWMRHDPRVIEWTRYLSKTGGQTDLARNTMAEVLEFFAGVELDSSAIAD